MPGFKRNNWVLRIGSKWPLYVYKKNFLDLKDELNAKREKLKLKIDTEAQSLVEQFDLFEKNCVLICRSVLKSEYSLNLRIEVNKKKLDSWFMSLNKIRIDNIQWDNIEREAFKVNNQTKNECKKVKEKLLLNKHQNYSQMLADFNAENIFSDK